MPTLRKDLRSDLERTVVKARDIAEAAATAALQALAVDQKEPFPHLSPEDRSLRVRLRSHGRSLGDRRDPVAKTQGLSNLAHAVAYEQWHRMLFARFLIENDSLIEPEHRVALAMREVEDLARETNINVWDLAGQYAEQMLPQIFRSDDPALDLKLPAETRQKLEKLLSSLPPAVFKADDSLGWVYQFWQSTAKEQANKSGDKIDSSSISAVTQLFTEDYMVDFILHNTLGAWWAARCAEVSNARFQIPDCPDEAAARKAASLPAKNGLPAIDWDYLRMVARPSRSGSGPDETDRDSLATPDFSTLQTHHGENLPHWHCDHAIYHVVFRLADSVPLAKREEWLAERSEIELRAQREHRELTEHEVERLQFLYSEKIETFLDSGHGECLLARPEIGDMVAGALAHFDGQRYHLHAWCVMPNHVHVLVEPQQGNDLSAIIHSWKSFTSHSANRLLGRNGAFWQKDAYNHIIRTEREYQFQLRYIAENPVKAGLRNWKWVVARPSRSGSDHPQPQTGTVWLPAAGTFDGWPKRAAEITFLDPCMGSGHFLAAALPIVARLRMAEENLSPEDAVIAVLRDNLHGLELDPRCAQLAGFNLALAAWKFAPGLLLSGRALPPLQLACCGQAPVGTREEWLQVLEGRGNMELRFFLGQLYDVFQQAPLLGSLIQPRRVLGGLFDSKRLAELFAAVDAALAESHPNLGDRYETGVVVQGIAKAVQLLSKTFTLVITNVPYLARGKQTEKLRAFIEDKYPAGKADLATAFVLRCLDFCAKGGTTALVTPQNWLFLKSYQKLREDLLRNTTWDWVARLGPKGFQTPMWDFNVMLFSLTRHEPAAGHPLAGLDVAEQTTPAEKADALRTEELHVVAQAAQLDNPDARVSLEISSNEPLLETIADAVNGMHAGDSLRYRFNYWEVLDFGDWCFLQGTHSVSEYYGGKEYIFSWNNDGNDHRENPNARIQGDSVWSKKGVVISMMQDLPVVLYSGDKFDISCTPIVPHNQEHTPAIWAFCSSKIFNVQVRRIDQKLNVTNATLAKVPFDLAHWTAVAKERYPNGLPEPYSPDPTQWLFKGRVDDATEPLQVAVARLLGYRWPAETDPEKAGVEIFPSDRAFWEGLSPHADADGIVCLTPLRGEPDAASRLLGLLHRAWELAREHPYQLPANWRDDEIPAAPRALDFPTAEAWISHLLSRAGARDMPSYLRDSFFEEHCRIFQNRPFIWHLWDGRPDGFHALVNYHKLAAVARPSRSGSSVPTPDRDGLATLETLTYAYLGDWIRRQRDDANNGIPGAESRMLAAESLQQELKHILQGEPPYDLFIRWKPLHQQAIGWHPDLNDGVRLNIRPFLLAKDVKKKGAGILRHKPNINWNKDRGKEPLRLPEDYPWFWGWDEKTVDFKATQTHDGNRWNDCHYTIAAKQAAQLRHSSQSTHT